MKAAQNLLRETFVGILVTDRYASYNWIKTTCQRILKQKQALWTFVEIEGVEPTHNLAEQLIRFYVLWRKSSFGTQSERGNLFVERMMITTATCQLQGRNRYDYITTAVSAHIKGFTPAR